jgi:hypothetical protein
VVILVGSGICTDVRSIALMIWMTQVLMQAANGLLEVSRKATA